MDIELLGGLRSTVPSSENGETSLSEFAYNRIVQMMLAGILRPGEVLQERVLAESLSMSRTPVREALTRLETESLVSRQLGRVLVVSDTSLESYMAILDLRTVLEFEAAQRATGRISSADVKTILTEIDLLLNATTVTPAHHWAVDEMVHGTIAEAAGNPLMALTIRDLRRRTHIFDTARIPHRLPTGASEHIGLLNAVAGDDPLESARLMREHLDNVKSAIIDFILGTRHLDPLS